MDSNPWQNEHAWNKLNEFLHNYNITSFVAILIPIIIELLSRTRINYLLCSTYEYYEYNEYNALAQHKVQKMIV